VEPDSVLDLQSAFFCGQNVGGNYFDYAERRILFRSYAGKNPSLDEARHGKALAGLLKRYFGK